MLPIHLQVLNGWDVTITRSRDMAPPQLFFFFYNIYKLCNTSWFGPSKGPLHDSHSIMTNFLWSEVTMIEV